MREASGEEEQESAMSPFPCRMDTGCGAESRPYTGAREAEENPKGWDQCVAVEVARNGQTQDEPARLAEGLGVRSGFGLSI